MKAPAYLLFFLFGLVSSLFATTVATQDERTVAVLSAAMSAFGRANGDAIPYGDNVAVVARLKEVGLVISDPERGPNGEVLDQWKNPIQFLRCGDSYVVILILGEKSEDRYARPTCVLVRGKPFEANSPISKK